VKQKLILLAALVLALVQPVLADISNTTISTTIINKLAMVMGRWHSQFNNAESQSSIFETGEMGYCADSDECRREWNDRSNECKGSWI